MDSMEIKCNVRLPFLGDHSQIFLKKSYHRPQKSPWAFLIFDRLLDILKMIENYPALSKILSSVQKTGCEKLFAMKTTPNFFKKPKVTALGKVKKLMFDRLVNLFVLSQKLTQQIPYCRLRVLQSLSIGGSLKKKFHIKSYRSTKNSRKFLIFERFLDFSNILKHYTALYENLASIQRTSDFYSNFGCSSGIFAGSWDFCKVIHEGDFIKIFLTPKVLTFGEVNFFC